LRIEYNKKATPGMARLHKIYNLDCNRKVQKSREWRFNIM